MDILWLIDTDNFDSIQTRFYGWTISENDKLLLNQFPSVCDAAHDVIETWGFEVK